MKNLILVILIISPFILNAQTDKKFILRSSFGYNYSHIDGIDNYPPPSSRDHFGEINNKLNFSINAGRKLKSNFYYGMGIAYDISKQEINPDKDAPDPKNPLSSGFFTMTSYLYEDNVEKTVSPFIYLQYFSSLSERITLSLQLYSKYDFYKESTKYIGYSPNLLNNVYDVFLEHSKKTEKQFLNFGLQPSLRFVVYKRLGMEFTFGSIVYQQKISDSRIQSMVKVPCEFEMNFKPENWQIGFFLEL